MTKLLTLFNAMFIRLLDYGLIFGNQTLMQLFITISHVIDKHRDPDALPDFEKLISQALKANGWTNIGTQETRAIQHHQKERSLNELWDEYFSECFEKHWGMAEKAPQWMYRFDQQGNCMVSYGHKLEMIAQDLNARLSLDVEKPMKVDTFKKSDALSSGTTMQTPLEAL